MQLHLLLAAALFIRERQQPYRARPALPCLGGREQYFNDLPFVRAVGARGRNVRHRGKQEKATADANHRARSHRFPRIPEPHLVLTTLLAWADEVDVDRSCHIFLSVRFTTIAGQRHREQHLMTLIVRSFFDFGSFVRSFFDFGSRRTLSFSIRCAFAS